jgi:ribosomal protein S18 acetylase RimI-like enzyme
MPAKIRSYTDSDLPKVVALLNESRKGSYEFLPFTEQTIKLTIDEQGLKIVIAEENGTLLGLVAYDYGQWGEELRWLTVKEATARKSIQDALVNEAEKYVVDGKVFVSVDADSPEITRWRERGYNLEGGLYHMVARLNCVRDSPAMPQGVVLRTLNPSEEADFIKLVNDGFGWERLQPDAVQEWKNDFPGFDESWIHVADYRGRLVSTVVAREDLKYNVSFKARRGYLGPAATLAEFRRKNVATALTQKAMNSLYGKGMDSVALHTHEQNVASMKLLERLGLKIAHHWVFVRKDIPSKT